MNEVELPTIAAEEVGKKRARTDGTRKRGNAEEEDGAPVSLDVSEAFTLHQRKAKATGRCCRQKKTKGKAVNVCIDFSYLPDSVRQVAAEKVNYVTHKQRTEALIEQLEREQESIAPNLKASVRFSSSEQKLDVSASLLDQARDTAKKALLEFTRVKEMRVQRFMKVFENVAVVVGTVYKELTLGTRAHDVEGNAYLTLEDGEEPYNGGTRYHATPPMKRFMTIELLSGGERTMAALALLFAIHQVSPTPFLVLDEVDAALDAGNVMQLSHYIRRHAAECQFVVVSLKEQLYHVADSLIGIFKDHNRESSGTLTLDLRPIAA